MDFASNKEEVGVSDGNEMLFINDCAGAQRDWWSWAGGCSLELTLFFLKICPQFASTHHFSSLSLFIH